MRKYLEFELEGCFFAIPAEKVTEIINYQIPKRLPNVNSHIEGVINHRGNIVTVLNLKKVLDLCNTEPPKKLILLADNCEKTLTALAVDRVVGMNVVEENKVNRELSWQIFLNNKVVDGVLIKGEYLVTLLNTDFLFSEMIGVKNEW